MLTRAQCLLVGALIVGCAPTTGEDVTQDSGSSPTDDSAISDSGTPGSDAGADAPPPMPVKLVVEPDDGASAITGAIAGAKSSVHLEMYLLTDDGAENALITAKTGGKDVKVLLEQKPYPDTSANQAAYDKLHAAGVDVHWTNGTFSLTHSKFFVVDGAAAWIMTLNLTGAGLAGNREYAAVDTSPADVAEAEQIFGADFAGTATTPTGALVVSPVNARGSIRALLDGATTSIDVEMEELSDDEMVQRLGNAAAKGVAVRVVVPKSGRSTDTNTSIATMTGRGVQVRALSSPDVHAKAIVVDQKTLYVGSVNLTAASLDFNREVGMIVTDADAVARASSTIGADFSKGAAP